MKIEFLKFWSSKTIPGVMWGPTENLGPIGSAVLTLIVFKQTYRHQDKQYIFMDIVKIQIKKINVKQMFDWIE